MELGPGEGAAPSAEMEALLAAIDRFCERRKERRADGEVAAELIHLRHGCDRLELEFSDSAAVFATTDVFDRQGSTSPIDWIRHNCHLTGPAAAARVDVGNNLDRLPQSVAALEAREIGFAHLTAMARTADVLYNSETAAGFDEAALLVKARENSPGKFYYICRHARHAADPKGYAGEQAEQVENRSLSLSMWEDGTYAISGVLDTVGGAALRSALEPLARRKGAHDHRDRKRRMGDALVEFVERAQPARLQVTTSLETLLGLSGAPAAEMDFSLPISSQTVERLACDCSLTRILLGSDSMVIDVGRSKRTVEGPRRTALEVRDRHCRWPGCDRPAKWSAAHHVVHWIHGGSTDLDNLVLLCHRHHWMVHEGKWQLVLAEDGQMLAIPPTTSFGACARAPSSDAAA